MEMNIFWIIVTISGWLFAIVTLLLLHDNQQVLERARWHRDQWIEIADRWKRRALVTTDMQAQFDIAAAERNIFFYGDGSAGYVLLLGDEQYVVLSDKIDIGWYGDPPNTVTIKGVRYAKVDTGESYA